MFKRTCARAFFLETISSAVQGFRYFPLDLKVFAAGGQEGACIAIVERMEPALNGTLPAEKEVKRASFQRSTPSQETVQTNSNNLWDDVVGLSNSIART